MGTPQPSPNPASSPVLDPEEAILRRLGYVQVLYREMGGFSNFAISFTIISILAGCLTSFGDHSYWLVFGLGLLMAQYTITGYDASAHMSEETQAASRAAAWGTVMSVVLSVVLGFFLLVALTFAVPDVQGTLDAGANAVTYIWSTALGQAWAELLLFIAVVAQFFCGTASLTAASRMLLAFSRDRAVPGWRLWRAVAANRVPVNAVTAIAVLSWALMLPTLINGAIGYLVGTSIAVIGLYIAFALPILLRIRAGERFERGAWNLGRHYRWIAPLAVAWIVVICVLFLLPVSPKGIPGADDFDWNVVNYAPLTVGAAVLLFGGWYLLSARHWFVGPIPDARLDDGLRWSITPQDITPEDMTSPDGTSRAGTSPPPVPTPQPDLFGAD